MQLFFDFPVNPDYSFKSFVACSGNQTALKFVQRVISGEESLLYLHGDSGSGKTHLLHAAAKELATRGSVPVIPVELVTHDNLEEITTSAATSQGLLLDNLHLLADSPLLRTAFWQLFNDFYESGRKIIATATLPPKELDSLDDHLKSRFMWGLVAKLDISDDTSRRMIMKKLADDRQLIIPDDVIDYLLIRLPRDIPSLANAVERLKQESFATQRKISLKLTKATLPGL
ncbi:MAG: DnaA regulatory inactivator Hda [Geobacteraceae bacterium]|nr:DnaA regulatory inactivator Hda [Geobacteraceae bacterium]